MISRRAILIGGVALTGGAAFVGYSMSAADGLSTLSVAEAHAAALAGDILLVDIRRPDEWIATGVPASAIAVDLRRSDFTLVLGTLRTSPSQPIALICARGVRSRRLANALVEAGIGPIIDVPEGMLGSLAGPGWLKSGLPLKVPG